MTARLTGRAARAFERITYPKFGATVDEAGVPNVVPLLSARMIDPETIVFVKFMVWKTRRNFESNGKIALACPGPGGRGYLVQGRFEGWITHGPILEEIEKEPLYRYNAYMGANRAGRIRVCEVQEFDGGGMLSSLAKSFFLPGRRGRPKTSACSAVPGRAVLSGPGRPGPMLPVVEEKWRRRLALKFAAVVDERGEPAAAPVPEMFVLSSGELVFPRPEDRRHPLYPLCPEVWLAASVLTPEPAAYQVKGRFAGWEKRSGREEGRLVIEEVYTAAPPVPGQRIYPPEEERD